jgi:hypothetical protein
MLAYPYKTQVEIVVASMTLHNYIRRRSHDDVAFAEFDRNLNYVPDEIFSDVVAHSEINGNCSQGRMNFIRDRIANSLMEQ